MYIQFHAILPFQILFTQPVNFFIRKNADVSEVSNYGKVSFRYINGY